ncbi:MAG: cell division protein FtsQ/DivIB [Proteobacteria bacterium]|nr:cell division protein FtsQ/DivIB [Pseudomonadota bacterium]
MIALRDLWPRRARNRARVEKPRRFKLPAVPWKRLAPLAVGVGAVAVLAGSIALALDRPVRRIDVAGSFQRVSPLDVEQVVRSRLRGGFVTANLEALQRSIEALPWVDRARVQRRWPDALLVQVTEQAASARWGATGLLNARGELFLRDARHVPPELPRLDGPDGSERQVAELLFQLQPRLAEIGLRISALRLDPRGAWELELANGVSVRFGRRQLQERVERFIKVGAPVVAGRPNDIAFLDMRYSNGFTVGWRTTGAPQSRPAAGEDRELSQKRDQDA